MLDPGDRIQIHWEHEEAKRESGLIDPRQERLAVQLKRTISEHADEWEQSLRAKGRTTDHCERVRGHVDVILSFTHAATLLDIQAEHIERYAAHMESRGRYPRTIQSHLRSIKQFTKWCVENNRLHSDPLASVKPPNPNSKRKIERRAFSVEEWILLRTTTSEEPRRFDMDGSERALLYEVSLQSGLRANELRELIPAKLELSVAQPYVLAKSQTTKNAKPARQCLTQDLASKLAQHISGKRDRVFPNLTPDTAEMLRADLHAARARYLKEHTADESDFLTEENAAGERYDFHALRHTCGAWLALAGEHPKAIQSIMRHSSITLTMDTYGHLFPSMEASAIRNLGQIMEGIDPREIAQRKCQ